MQTRRKKTKNGFYGVENRGTVDKSKWMVSFSIDGGQHRLGTAHPTLESAIMTYNTAAVMVGLPREWLETMAAPPPVGKGGKVAARASRYFLTDWEKRETKNYKGPDYDEGEDVKVDVATLRVVDTGYDGVEETPTGKWTAFIGGRGTAGPKTVFKEEYDTIKQAVTARNTAALYLGRHWDVQWVGSELPVNDINNPDTVEKLLEIAPGLRNMLGKNVGASGYRGVKVPTQAHGPGSYEGRYSLNKQQKTICYSSDPVEAAKAFNNAAVYLFDSKINKVPGWKYKEPPQYVRILLREWRAAAVQRAKEEGISREMRNLLLSGSIVVKPEFHEAIPVVREDPAEHYARSVRVLMEWAASQRAARRAQGSGFGCLSGMGLSCCLPGGRGRASGVGAGAASGGAGPSGAGGASGSGAGPSGVAASGGAGPSGVAASGESRPAKQPRISTPREVIDLTHDHDEQMMDLTRDDESQLQ